MKNIFCLFFIVVFLFFLGCEQKAEITQEATLGSCISCKYEVRTCVWARMGIGGADTIEKIVWQYDVEPQDVCKVKKQQYQEVYPTYLELQKVLKNHINCPEPK